MLFTFTVFYIRPISLLSFATFRVETNIISLYAVVTPSGDCVKRHFVITILLWSSKQAGMAKYGVDDCIVLGPSGRSRRDSASARLQLPRNSLRGNVRRPTKLKASVPRNRPFKPVHRKQSYGYNRPNTRSGLKNNSRKTTLHRRSEVLPLDKAANKSSSSASSSSSSSSDDDIVGMESERRPQTSISLAKEPIFRTEFERLMSATMTLPSRGV